MSVILMSNMVVRPHCQNLWQLALPCSSVAVGGCGVSAVGVDESAVSPAAVCTRRLMQENILGSCSTQPGESAVPHKCLHSSTTSSCRICTRPPVLHDRASSTVILAPQPLQAEGISSGEWLYCRRTISLHLSANSQAGTIQLIWENPKPCASGTVSFNRCCHGRFAASPALEEGSFILKLISPSCQAGICGAQTMRVQIKPCCRIHKRHRQVASCCKGCLVSKVGPCL